MIFFIWGFSPSPYPPGRLKLLQGRWFFVVWRGLRLCRSSLVFAVRPFFVLGSVRSSYLCFMGSLSLSSILSPASAVGFCGSRSAVPPVAVSSLVFSLVGSSVPVSVGCARGFDSVVRGAFPGSQVFSVSSFGSGRGAFARRSSAFVSSLASVPGSVLFSAPGRSCPSGLFPSASSSSCFCGLGSGSWASVALALGLGVPCVVWVASCSWVPSGWGFVSLGSGFFFSSGSQLCLF